MIVLRDGTIANSPQSDALKDSDPRNEHWSVNSVSSFAELSPVSRIWTLDEVLDQGFTGGCVGFAFAHWLAAEPARHADITADFAREKIYHEAQRIDRWSGGEYPGAEPISSGTSVLAAAKVLKNFGYIERYYWAKNLTDLVLALSYAGPVVMGIPWYRDMKQLHSDLIMRASGPLIGRHCLLALGVQISKTENHIDNNKSFICFQNSSGSDWGNSGRAKMSFSSLSSLIEDSEICIPTPPGSSINSSGNLSMHFLRMEADPNEG